LDHTAVPAINEVIREVAAETDGRVAVLDLYELVCDDGEFVDELFGDPNAREDGLHFSESVASELAKEVAGLARSLGPVV
ncbi:MAG: hypothetical protein OES57_15540, partial [Acidimicrobiia bacterium]|nr:hypothetical protein [Acidimicrobiia bacterium]